MPSAAISQSLSSLLPSITAPPPHLISLAESLLALSRQRASHLKAEEEIARAYACCEIACDRLRAQLRLPPTKKGGAPCKPVVYRKLLGYLEKVLGNDGASTPGKRKRDAEVEIGETPKKRVRQTPDVTPSKSTSKKDGGFVGKVKAQVNQRGKEDKEAPDFVMPAIRRLCKTFNTPEMAPHVYTGTCVVLGLADLWPPQSTDSEAGMQGEVTTLLAALYLMVLTRMQRGKMTTRIFRGTSSKAVHLFNTISNAEQIEDWIKRINKEGYCKGQHWWESVPEEVFTFSLDKVEAGDITEDVIQEAEDGDDIILRGKQGIEIDQDGPEGVLLPGLGTMLHDGVDWLSEERTVEFEIWKRNLIKQMDRMDKGNRGVAVAS
jgi:origin recognition complex subunit 6